MKTVEKMIQAIKEWVNARIRVATDELDMGSVLRRTGDASKVTSVFTTYGSRKLPESGEELAVMLGKMTKYLSDMQGIAFDENYKKLYNVPISSNYLGYHDAVDAAIEKNIITVDGSSVTTDFDDIWNMGEAILLYGVGGTSTSAKQSTTDFLRAYLLYKKRADTATGAGAGYAMIQLGSWGSYARWSLTATLTTATVSKESLVLKVPKGAWAEVSALSLITH